MWIQELNLKNFGKFQNKKIQLTSGINVIYGENESGKSTLHAFIRGCLFGIRKARGRAAKTDVYSRYQPWENPAYYAGMLRFVCEKKVFRLERDFTKGPQTGVLVCESDGERLDIEKGDLEMLLGNIGEVTFDNTVSIGQLKNETDEGLALELKNYMANLEGTGDGSIRVEKATALLKEKKRQLEKQLQKLKQEDEEKVSQIQTRIRFLTEEKEKESQELERVKIQMRHINEAKETDGKNEPKETILPPKKRIGLIRRFFLWLKNLFFHLFHKENPKGGKGGEISGQDIWQNRNQTDRQEYGDEKARLAGKLEYLENQIREKEVLIENARDEIEVQKESYHGEQVQKLQEEISACQLAMERISQVVSSMQVDTGQFLKKRTSEIFAQITGGKYRWVEVSEDLMLGVHGQEHYIPVEQLSRGTIWQLYFALRMAANEVLGQNEELPVILDDAFVMYDEKRLGQSLSWLAGQKRQVILFTCQKREQEWLAEHGVPFHKVCL